LSKEGRKGVDGVDLKSAESRAEEEERKSRLFLPFPHMSFSGYF
jgi:hypothetical protein